MKEILNALKELGYMFYDENILDGYNDYLRICITFSPDKNVYCVQYALLSYFDRWANSGYEEKFKTKEEVINFFKDEKSLLVKAINEILYYIVKQACDCEEKDKHYILNELNDTLQSCVTKIEMFKLFNNETI